MYELAVIENNNSAHKLNISTKNNTNVDTYTFVYLFCNTKKKYYKNVSTSWNLQKPN